MFCGSYESDEKSFVTQWLHHGDGSDHNVTLQVVVAVSTEWPPLVWSDQEMRTIHVAEVALSIKQVRIEHLKRYNVCEQPCFFY